MLLTIQAKYILKEENKAWDLPISITVSKARQSEKNRMIRQSSAVETKGEIISRGTANSIKATEKKKRKRKKKLLRHQRHQRRHWGKEIVIPSPRQKRFLWHSEDKLTSSPSSSHIACPISLGLGLPPCNHQWYPRLLSPGQL